MRLSPRLAALGRSNFILGEKKRSTSDAPGVTSARSRTGKTNSSNREPDRTKYKVARIDLARSEARLIRAIEKFLAQFRINSLLKTRVVSPDCQRVLALYMTGKTIYRNICEILAKLLDI